MNERGLRAGMRARTLVVLLCQCNAGEVSVSQQAAFSEGAAGPRTLANIRGDVLSDGTGSQTRHIYEPAADATPSTPANAEGCFFDVDAHLICRVMTDSVPGTKPLERRK